MKAIIFNDKDNSDRSLNRLNLIREKGKQRFWKIRLFHDYMFQKVKEVLGEQAHCLELVKTLLYTNSSES